MSAMINGSVYHIHCSKTGLSYVGVTQKTVEHRWQCHWKRALRGGSGRLWKAIRRHGVNAFLVTTLESGITSRQELHLAERKWISKLRTLHPSGYNIMSGGSGPDYGPAFKAICLRSKQSPAFRAAISKIRRLAWKNPAYAKRVIASQIAARRLRWENPEYRRKISAAMAAAQIKRYRNPKAKKKAAMVLAETQKRMRRNPLFRRKMSKVRSESARRQWQNSDVRRRMSAGISAAMTGNPKAAAARRKLWKQSNYRTKTCKAMSVAAIEVSRKRWADPARRKHQSNAMRLSWARRKAGL